jgi:hypothetical protein
MASMTFTGRRSLGPRDYRPLAPRVGRPYFEAETALQVLEQIQDPEGGSTSSKWWTQSQPIRTVAELPMSFPLHETRPPFAYQYLAERASELWHLGMSASAMARAFGVSGKTVTKAVRYRVKIEHLARVE